MKSSKFTLLMFGLILASCKNNSATSEMKSAPPDALPKTARCAQVSEIETIVVHETLLVKLESSSISGTYQFTTGERDSIQDAGFQHLVGSVSEVSSTESSATMKLSEGTLSVYFDEDFAPEKKLTEIKLDYSEKKVGFTIEGDARETVVGNCTFD